MATYRLDAVRMDGGSVGCGVFEAKAKEHENDTSWREVARFATADEGQAWITAKREPGREAQRQAVRLAHERRRSARMTTQDGRNDDPGHGGTGNDATGL